MSPPKGTSNSNKTAHVMNLLRKSNPAPAADNAETEQPAAPAPQTPPILASLSADLEVSTHIRDALSDALTDEAGPPATPPKHSEPPAEELPASPSISPEEPAPVRAKPAEPLPVQLDTTLFPSFDEPDSLAQETVSEAVPDTPPAPDPETPAASSAQRTAPSEEDAPPPPADLPDDEPVFTNLMQRLTEEKAGKYIDLFGLCSCNRCRQEVVARALNDLPPRYLVVRPSELAICFDMYTTRYSSEITAQLLRACKEVMEHPSHD